MAGYPDVFSDITLSAEKMLQLLETETAVVHGYDGGCGSLNLSNPIDFSYMAEIQAISEIIQSVSKTIKYEDIHGYVIACLVMQE